MRRFPVILLLLLAFGCREPRSTERFIKGPGPYVFVLDMADTLSTYDVDIFTRVDGEVPPEISLKVQWTAPSHAMFQETVYLPLSEEVYQPYRRGMRPPQAGEWTVTLTPLSMPEGLWGMGLVVTKRPWDTEN